MPRYYGLVRHGASARPNCVTERVKFVHVLDSRAPRKSAASRWPLLHRDGMVWAEFGQRASHPIQSKTIGVVRGICNPALVW